MNRVQFKSHIRGISGGGDGNHARAHRDPCQEGRGTTSGRGTVRRREGRNMRQTTGPLYILEAKSLLGHENTEYSSRQDSTPPFLFLKDLVDLTSYVCTGWMGWMTHRKWKESEQQPGTAGPGNMFGCCLMSFHFLWAIHPIRPV